MAWIYLVLAGVLEVAFALGLKATEGFTRLVPSVLTILAMGASIGLLTLAMKNLPVGTAYAVWTGIGASGAVVGGILVYQEPATPLRLFSIALVVAGIIGLKVA